MTDFAPRGGGTAQAATPAPTPAKAAGQGRARARDTRQAIDAMSQFPSREASTDGQLNLKGPRQVLNRFKLMCKQDRRAYYDMLEILMDHFEGNR